MANIRFIAALLFVINYLPVWTRPNLADHRRRPCLLQKQMGQILGIDRVLRRARPSKLLQKGALPTRLGPKRTKHYNPTYGYEPYWEKGDWVFEETEPKESDMCGTRCKSIHEQYGPICGRNKYHEHHSFLHYCEMMNVDCEGRDGWLIAYRGYCQVDLLTYATAAKQVVTRANSWLKNYSAIYYDP